MTSPTTSESHVKPSASATPSLRSILSRYFRDRPAPRIAVDAVIVGAIYFVLSALFSAAYPPTLPVDPSTQTFAERLLDPRMLFGAFINMLWWTMAGLFLWAGFRCIADAIRERP